MNKQLVLLLNLLNSIVVLLLLTPARASGEVGLYWSQSEGPPLQTATSDGGQIRTLIPEELVMPIRGTIPMSDGRLLIYSSDRIWSINDDGSGLQLLVSNQRDIQHLTLNSQLGKMYWTDGALGQILTASLNGSSVQVLISGRHLPNWITVDESSGNLYWADSTSASNPAIYRSSAIGTDIAMMFSGPTGGTAVNGMIIDHANSRLLVFYHKVVRFVPPTESGTTLQAISLNGGGVTELFYRMSTNLADPGIDADAGMLYFRDGSNFQSVPLNDPAADPAMLFNLDYLPSRSSYAPSSDRFYVVTTSLATRVRSVNISGGDEQILISADLNFINKLAVSSTANKVFFLGSAPTDSGSDPIQGRVYAFDLATHTTTALTELTSSDLTSIVADDTQQRVFWSTSNSIRSVSYAGGPEETVLTITGYLIDIAIGVEGSEQKLYWAVDDKVYRAAIDGTNQELLYTADEYRRVFSIAAAPTSGKLLLVDIPYGPVVQQYFIKSLDLNTLETQVLVTAYSMVQYELAVDDAAGEMYWFSLTDPNRPDVTFHRAALDGSGDVTIDLPAVTERALALGPVLPVLAADRDYDGDGLSDPAVYRRLTGQFYVNPLGSAPLVFGFLNLPFTSVSGDFDGDKKTDFALVISYASYLHWFVLQSGDGELLYRVWGYPGDYVVVSDFNGDGSDDFGIYRSRDNTSGAIGYSKWYVLYRDGSTETKSWGLDGDIPVAHDWDGDGKADFAVWRPVEGNWYLSFSSGGDPSVYQWGLPGDIPVAGDYFGDERLELGVWRPGNGTWYLRSTSSSEIEVTQWGLPGDTPAPGDYDGNGKSERTVWRPTDGNWFINYGAGSVETRQWGLQGDTVPKRSIRILD